MVQAEAAGRGPARVFRRRGGSSRPPGGGAGAWPQRPPVYQMRWMPPPSTGMKPIFLGLAGSAMSYTAMPAVQSRTGAVFFSAVPTFSPSEPL